jgi:hypothetical protein
MKYNNFNNYKINESNLMGLKDFSNFEIKTNVDCDIDIFNIFPKHSFVIVLNSGKCYVYSKKNNRKKYQDIETLQNEMGIDLSDSSIISTKNGRYIKEQYEQKSGLKVSDIFQIIEM